MEYTTTRLLICNSCARKLPEEESQRLRQVRGGCGSCGTGGYRCPYCAGVMRTQVVRTPKPEAIQQNLPRSGSPGQQNQNRGSTYGHANMVRNVFPPKR